jgi:hypothetical protein
MKNLIDIIGTTILIAVLAFGVPVVILIWGAVGELR